jgi:AbiV family abortive infection protein
MTTGQHWEVFRNAERLLRSAQTLFDSGDYRTAISIAVLAAEETGKIGLLGMNAAEQQGAAAERKMPYERQLSDHNCKLDYFFVICQMHMLECSQKLLMEKLGLPDTRDGRTLRTQSSQ